MKEQALLQNFCAVLSETCDQLIRKPKWKTFTKKKKEIICQFLMSCDEIFDTIPADKHVGGVGIFFSSDI